MQSPCHVNNVQKTGVSYTSTRFVYNTNTHNGCSSNWKADWSKFLGRTYAQVVSSNPKSRLDRYSTHVKQITNLSVTHRGRSNKSKRPTCFSESNPVTARIKTQRPYSVSKHMISGPKHGNAHFCIPVTNRFESLGVLDEKNTDCESANNNSNVNYEASQIQYQISECKSSRLIKNTNTSPPVKKVSNTDKQIHDITKVSNTGTQSKQVSPYAKQLMQKQHNTDSWTQNSTPKVIKLTDQKHGKMCPKNHPPEDKYELALAVKNKNKIRLQQASSDPTHQKWSKQNQQRFGFIPLSPLLLPNTNLKRVLDADPIQLYDITKNSDSFNFMTDQIQVKSQLNPDVWEQCLKDYWDSQLCHLIRYGFPLDFNRNSQLGQNSKNHRSATMFPDDVEAYIQEEIGFGAIVGPFSDPPFQELHISPFMTREKPGGAHRRVIMDLSFPQGGAVNTYISKDTYLGTDFILTLPSIDHITSKIKQLGKGSLIYKVDISRAFRHIKIDPRDYFLLGLKHKNYYLDTCLPFGYRNGSGIFQRLSDAIRFIMGNMGYDVINYIDDVIGFGTISTADPSYQTLMNLLQKLGFDISIKKLVRPCTKATCLGVEVDTRNFTVAVPQEKLANIYQICTEWVGRQRCTKKQLQSLLGSLLYISKCVHSSRFFLNRMLDTLRSHFGKDEILLDINFHRDLNWFLKFLPYFNGTAFFNHTPSKKVIELDACLEGLGAIFENQVYSIQIPKNFENYTIVHLEMLNILVALRLWCNQWKTNKILLKCDNQAVVSVLNSGKTQDLTLGAMARNISMLLAIYDIELQVIHILGADNKVADLLSRWFITENPDKRLYQFIKNPLWLSVNHEFLKVDWSI